MRGSILVALASLVAVSASCPAPSPATADADSRLDADAGSDGGADADIEGGVSSDAGADADLDLRCEVGPAEAPCAAGGGRLERARCDRLSLECPDAGVAVVEVRRADPSAPRTGRGLVVAASAGGARAFFEDDEVALGLLESLLAGGFSVVQTAWVSRPRGASGDGPGPEARFTAALLAWLRASLDDGEALCAVGDGAAASELAYALSWWDAGASVDMVVLTSGPVATRLDLGCLGAAADEAWPARCRRIIPGCSMLACEDHACTFDAAVAAEVDAAFGGAAICGGAESDAERLLAASVMAPGAALELPRTRVQVFTGTLDCSAAVPMALEYANAITSERDMRCVHAVGSPLPHFEDGAAAILDALLSECEPRH